MRNDDDDDEYKVGYGKPPKSSRIKPGEVRNPNGKRGKNPKPPEGKSDAEIVARIDDEIILVKGKKMTRREAVLRAFQAKSMMADAKAHSVLEAIRNRAKLEAPEKKTGVLLIPVMESPAHWEEYAKWQQAKFREDPNGFEALYPDQELDENGRLRKKVRDD